jgi:hypothetical protein
MSRLLCIKSSWACQQAGAGILLCEHAAPLTGVCHDEKVCGGVQAALLLVLKESFKVYKAISEGLINLADKFFEMDYLDAQKGLEIYRQSILDSERLQVGVMDGFRGGWLAEIRARMPRFLGHRLDLAVQRGLQAA